LVNVKKNGWHTKRSGAYGEEAKRVGKGIIEDHVWKVANQRRGC
jgi:hypothetical protein